MPVPLVAKGAVIAVSVAVAAAIAIYESEEVWRYTEDVRRRIAVAFQSVSDSFNPPQQQPRFNRPEDAEGFLQSSSSAVVDPGVDADEDSRRRQREELLYWNSIRLQKLKDQGEEVDDAAQQTPADAAASGRRSSSFDDFLKQDETAERGTFVFNSGLDLQNRDGLRRRGDGARGLSSALYANPFADENHIDNDELEELSSAPIARVPDEIFSDIYSATTREAEESHPAAFEHPAPLIDLEPAVTSSDTVSSPATLERELADDEYMSAGQEDRQEAYASIQAWAQDSSRNFYSPLPVTPADPVSEPELVSDGELTPTDSASLAGSGVDIANDVLSSRDGEHGRIYDVMSESEGMLTPASWSEVGSVVSDGEAPVPPMHS